MAQRAMMMPTRRFAAGQPILGLAPARLAAPSAFLTIKRGSAVASDKTAPARPDESYKILENQRLHRPVAPHLSIYKWQITMVLSISNRITGCILSGGLYIFGALYAAAPLLGLKISAAGMAAAFAKWPWILQAVTKLGLAVPFTFHSWNGIRHLLWDTGAALTNQQVVWTGWTVVGLTAVSSLALLFI